MSRWQLAWLTIARILMLGGPFVEITHLEVEPGHMLPQLRNQAAVPKTCHAQDDYCYALKRENYGDEFHVHSQFRPNRGTQPRVALDKFARQSLSLEVALQGLSCFKERTGFKC